MPHPKFGKIGKLLCGGGVIGGLAQAVQLREFEQAGIHSDWDGAVSVGAFNAITINAIETWQSRITSPYAIYDLNPVLKKTFKEARQFLAPFKKHESWKEWMHDFKAQKQNAVQFLLFLKRTILTALKIARDFPNNDFINPKDFASLSEFAISALKEHDLCSLQSILSIDPLIKIVEENIDLNSALKKEPPLNIFVRNLNTGKEHILNPKSIPELLLALRAASALVPFFEPVKIGEEYFCDIGAVNPFPAEHAFNAGCDTVFAFAKGYDPALKKPQNVIEMWFSEIEIHTRKMFMMLYNKARERAKKENKKLYLVTPQYPPHPDLGFLSISSEAIEYTTEKESKTTQEFLEKILK